MTRRAGYAVLAALVAVAVPAAAGVYALTGDDGSGDRAAFTPREPAAPAGTGGWTGTWATAPTAAEPGTERGLANLSVRNVVHTTVGGTRIRIQLSNAFGTAPLTLDGASVALAVAGGSAGAAPGSMRRLTFAQRSAVTVPVGRSVISDAVRLTVPADRDLLVTTYARTPSGPVTYHPHSRQISYAAEGDHTTDVRGGAFTQQLPFWRYLTGVDVWSTQARGAVAVIGDSLTDGLTSTIGANHRWTDFLAQRLRTEPGAPRYGVLNLGISGNRLLHDASSREGAGESALTRLDRDVLSRTNIKAVIVEVGVNDLLKSPQQTDPDAIVAGLRQITADARARGLRVTGATLMPFAGHPRGTKALEKTRTEVNRQIRAGGVFDAVLDFDAAVRDPGHPSRLLPAYDSGDHLHLTDAGFLAMAKAVDPAQLRGTTQAAL
ncbi:hypothetical protein SRB5_41120 [Streptomyces sp. RB5]|uniref:SGNH hydrolase-type esterase domain-containing protein n=1 Tax=Streptomyces smaragdinus TaxID=2585196 RepID=A0A7K0CLQ8_9ACTN|nr:SGNH/GDSL hydrolase family protein [Streptomyces smaragdinus]MQY13952.1 hypothetical protein [Streptomyces smaragdinus]